jgi:hypothetical protein
MTRKNPKDVVERRLKEVLVSRTDLEALLEYNEGDERKHWEEEGKPAGGHIYLRIRRLRS